MQQCSPRLSSCCQAPFPYAAPGLSKAHCCGSNATLFGCKHSLSGHLTVSLLPASMHHVNEALSPTLKRRKLKTENACHMAPTQACGDIQDGETCLSDPSLHIPCPFRCPPQKCSRPPLRQVSPARSLPDRRAWLDTEPPVSTSPAQQLHMRATTPSFLMWVLELKSSGYLLSPSKYLLNKRKIPSW